jgi:ADP-heptose:LPS heptosyltransferase
MKKILVIRNDKIGDFMLAWPAIALLKKSIPESLIVALVPEYTKDLAENCPWIDDVIIDIKNKKDKPSKAELVKKIKGYDFDYSICLFSNIHNASVVWTSKIPHRFAPATKICQLLYNHTLRQKRSQSQKSEYQYNKDLILYFLSILKQQAVDLSAPYLSFSESELKNHKAELSNSLKINQHQKWCFVHPGTGGSSSTLSIEQWLVLIRGLSEKNDLTFIITAGPGEEAYASQLHNKLMHNEVGAYLYVSSKGLMKFCCSIACADLFIAGSTGPLHIAGALDVPTVGFFPSKQSSTALRWRPINSSENHLAFSFEEHSEQNNIIDLQQVIVEIKSWAVWQ